MEEKEKESSTVKEPESEVKVRYERLGRMKDERVRCCVGGRTREKNEGLEGRVE